MPSLLEAVMAVPLQRTTSRVALTPCSICRYTVHSTESRAGCRHREGLMHQVCHAATCLDKNCVATSCATGGDCEVLRICDACGHRWCEEHSEAHTEDLERCSAYARDLCRQCHLDSSCRSRECWDDDSC